MSSPATPRRYDGTRRREAAQANRRLVVEAASRLFVERGWSGTSMRDVARAAGVSVETVYSSVGTKLDLLRVAMDVAVVGDDDPVPLSDRPEWRAVVDGPTAVDRARAVGDLLVRLHARTAWLHQALRHAAVGDPDLATMLQKDFDDIREQNRQGLSAVARREPTEEELDLVMSTLSNETYLMLTEHRHLTHADYREFVTTAITRLLGLEEGTP